MLIPHCCILKVYNFLSGFYRGSQPKSLPLVTEGTLAFLRKAAAVKTLDCERGTEFISHCERDISLWGSGAVCQFGFKACVLKVGLQAMVLLGGERMFRR
jgi:hypothetical protein